RNTQCDLITPQCHTTRSGARMLAGDERYLYPDSDAGKDRAGADVNVHRSTQTDTRRRSGRESWLSHPASFATAAAERGKVTSLATAVESTWIYRRLVDLRGRSRKKSGSTMRIP